MERERVRSASGQVQGEYALVIAGIALVCIAAALLLGGALSGLFGSTAGPLDSPNAPFEPPAATTPGLTWPASVDDCEDGGWKDYSQFGSEEECIAYVESLGP